jgi:hypothetical protein
MTCLDNTSDLRPWLQDAICRAVTGDGLLRRQLYTDSDVSVLAFRRVVALTSIDPGRLNGDLADRLLTVELDRISEASRSSEEDLAGQWANVHPGVLGGLLHTTVNVLAALPKVRHNGLPRMADFARVLLAVDQVMGTNGYTTYADQASKTAEQVAEGDSVTIAIRESIDGPWEGTASDLLKLLTAEKPPRDWPATPQGMGGRLVRAAPSLRSLGWVLEQEPRTNKARRWRVVPPLAEEYRAGSSPSSPLSPWSPTASDLREHGDDRGGESRDNALFGDDPGDEHTPGVSAGHDVSDEGDMSACTSSAPPAHDTPLRLLAPICDECGHPVDSDEHGRICEQGAA